MKSKHIKDVKIGLMTGIGLLALYIILTANLDYIRTNQERNDLENVVSASQVYSSNFQPDYHSTRER